MSTVAPSFVGIVSVKSAAVTVCEENVNTATAAFVEDVSLYNNAQSIAELAVSVVQVMFELAVQYDDVPFELTSVDAVGFPPAA